MAEKSVRIILRYRDGESYLREQVAAAEAAINAGLKPGDLAGVMINARIYGVKRNKAGSISVSPQVPDA